VKVTAVTRVAAVIGRPVRHSASPAIHNAAFAATGIDTIFVALEVEPAQLGDAVAGMGAMGFVGASVTVPHKQAVRDLCSRVDPIARSVGAVNCLSFERGEVTGHNTDADGFVAALHDDLGTSFSGLRAVLLGCGGAARAVYVGLERAGAGSVDVIARSPEAATWASHGACPWSAEILHELLGRCDLLVDCTSRGLHPETEAAIPAPIPLSRLPGSATVASLVYHREPRLLKEARARGLRAVDGTGMLVYQAARAFELWTGCSAPVEVMRKALRRAVGR